MLQNLKSGLSIRWTMGRTHLARIGRTKVKSTTSIYADGIIMHLANELQPQDPSVGGLDVLLQQHCTVKGIAVKGIGDGLKF